MGTTPGRSIESCRTPVRHGPYFQYTRKLGGKTLTRRLDAEQADLYREWIANRRHLDELITQMDLISRQAAELITAQLPRRHDRAPPKPKTRGPISPPRRAERQLGASNSSQIAATNHRNSHAIFSIRSSLSRSIWVHARPVKPWLRNRMLDCLHARTNASDSHPGHSQGAILE